MAKWNYAALSKAAKQNGGPEKLVEKLVHAGYNKGRASTLPLIGVIAVGSGALGFAISRAIDILKEKKAISPEELEHAKTEIIEGIKEYDAAHPESYEEDVPVEE